MARALKQTINHDCCAACGIKWIKHQGIAGACRALQYARLAGMEIAQENRRLKITLGMYRLALAIRRKPCGDNKPNRRTK